MKQSTIASPSADNSIIKSDDSKTPTLSAEVDLKNISTSKHQDLIAAEKKSIGFDYQFLYFLYILMNLKPNEKAGYEVKDDVHIELKDCKEVFIQLKHSLQTTKHQKTINLTEKDKDLWKSLYNWTIMINEKSYDEQKIKFINNTTFVLATNKENTSNQFFKELKSAKDKTKTIKELKQYLSLLDDSVKCKKSSSNNGKETDSEKLKKYISTFAGLDDNILYEFILSLEFELGFDDLINKIKEIIISNHVPEEQVDYILDTIVGNVSIWKFETVKNKEKIYISFQDFDKRVRRAYQIARGTGLIRHKKSNYILPSSIKEQNFIKGLIEINDIDETDINLMVQYTTYKLRISNYLTEWVQEGIITEQEYDEFRQLSIDIWKDTHKFYYHKIKRNSIPSDELNDLYIDAAIECLHEIRQKDLNLKNEVLQKDESNGYFYLLSDENEIGWKIDWQHKYRG